MSASQTGAVAKKDLRYYSLDFWRGVACLMVAFVHSTAYITENPAHVSGGFVSRKIFSLLGQGFAGVPIFFVISGYCIAAACESAMNKKLPTKQFFFRRFKRIFPPYWAVLLGLVALHLGFQFFRGANYLVDDIAPMSKPTDLSVVQWLGTITLTEGWRDNLFGDPSRLFLTPAWSLCYEEQFYFVCGMAMLFGRKWFYRLMAWLSVAVLAVAVINNSVVALPINGFFFDGRWLMFAAGVLVFYVLQFGTERSRKQAIYLLAFAFCAALAYWYRQHTAKTQQMFYITMARQMFCCFPVAILLIVLFKHDRRIYESRLLRPLTLCGVMCYSVYLVHIPVEKIMTQFFYRAGLQGDWSTLLISIPISILMAVLVAWGFYFLVERRFLNTPPPMSRDQKPAPAEEASVPAGV